MGTRERRNERQRLYRQRVSSRVLGLASESDRVRSLELQRERSRNAKRRQRDRLTEEQRQRRADTQRQYRANCAKSAIAAASTRDRISDSTNNEDIELQRIDSNVISSIQDQLLKSMGADGLDEWVCTVCDRLVQRTSCIEVPVSDSNYNIRLRPCLEPPGEGLHPLLIAEYNCGDIHDAFSGILVSRKGINCGGRVVKYRVCEDCDAALMRDSQKPPKFAIANGFFVGTLPANLCEATWIEQLLTQIVTVVAQTRVMRGGDHRAIRSHCMLFDATPGPPATLLPRRVDANLGYRVVLAGTFTNSQEERVRKMHQVRGSMVLNMLQFFKTNNPLYASVNVDITRLDEDSSALDNSVIIRNMEADEELVNEVDRAQDSIARPDDSNCVESIEDENVVIERNVILADQDAELNNGRVRVIDANPTQPKIEPQLKIFHSSRFATGEHLEARMHAHLFPFGRGHPEEERKTQVSKQECIRHYAMLSSRRFARDATFMLTAFSRLGIEKMHTMTSIRCKRYPSIFSGFETISPGELEIALRNNAAKQRGKSIPAASNPNVQRFLKSVELSSISVWGSNAERRFCRAEAFAYQTRYGQPSLFVTLSPNSDNSYAMAHYTGLLSVDTLFDSLKATVPCETEMKRAAMQDDCASARLFMRVVYAFITHALGVDMKTGVRSKTGGLFGHTKAYYGMVETQGRGTLHIHFLIWIAGAPINSSDYARKLESDGDAFKAKLLAYTTSIVTNELPLNFNDCRCNHCHAYGQVKPLPIPHGVRKKESRSKRKTATCVEPLLVECGQCGQKASAQHWIRQIMLQHRPNSWPPSLTSLSPDEFRERVSQELQTRNCVEEGEAAIRDREGYLAARSIALGDGTPQLFLLMNDAPQREFCHPRDDIFRKDPMARAIEMLPPSPDFHRMSKRDQDYLITSLVVGLNLHWWAHTGSCFKKSRATNSSAECRYNFPRDRVKEATFRGSVIQIPRPVLHEYVNGYNRTLMLALQANQDVQVLFGGEDATSRIYYCCKYVTKPQQQTDCSAALALASFQRRREKELANAGFESIADVQRKRVASMAYTFTNKQQVAGPLAALYLLRGSCNYASDNCVKLALQDALRQLEQTSGYSCVLVRTSETDETVYRSASALDDYVFRPSCLEDLSLYRFTMKCYRRQLGRTTSIQALYKDGHPLKNSHCVAYRKRDAVPVISGPRLPSCKHLAESLSKRETYSKLALVLFKPFRNIEDLLNGGSHPDAWSRAYELWEPQRDLFTKQIMENMDDYYVGREYSNTASNDASQAESTTENQYEDSSASESEAYGDSDLEELTDDEDTDTWFSGVNDGNEEALPIFPSPQTQTQRVKRAIDVLKQHQLIQKMCNGLFGFQIAQNANAQYAALDADALREWVNDPATDSFAEFNDGAEPNTTNLVSPTDVREIIDDALQCDELQWVPLPPSDPNVVALRDYASIHEVSIAFTLNKLQHAAFAIVGQRLLMRWRPDVVAAHPHVPSDDELTEKQLLFVLGGEGGTGKSRVIDALQTLCRCWQRGQSALITALTGKAATLIGGRTLASLEISLRNPNKWHEIQGVDALIIDEFSMLSKDGLLRIDRLLRKAKGIMGVPFGGIFVIMVGDFLQLPPVAADPLYIDPANRKRISMKDVEGFRLWRQFDTVVMLEESVRFNADPLWGVGCAKARYGEWTEEFVKVINERVVGQSNILDVPTGVNMSQNNVFVTADNDTRSSINGQFIADSAAVLPQDTYPIRVIANFKGALNKLSKQDLELVMGLPDNKFGRMAPFLDLIIGMPIQITQNIRTKKGVANGTMGKLRNVQFPAGTKFRKVQDRLTGVVVLLPDRRPLYALVELNRGEGAVPIAPDVDTNIFPVFPDTEAYQKATIELCRRANGESRTLSIRIQQFPFVCAVGATIYKVQGESLDSMTVVDWKADVRGVNKPQQAYLMVSRVRHRSGFTCMKPFTPSLARWSKPPEAALVEEARLKIESLRTLQEFSYA